MKKYIVIGLVLALSACERGTPAERVEVMSASYDYSYEGTSYYCYEYVNGKPAPVSCPSSATPN